MSDSDDEIFWGPVSARELQIIRHQLFPTDGSKNKEIETKSDSELGSSQKLDKKEETINDNFTSHGSSQSVEFCINSEKMDKKSESSPKYVEVQDDPSSDVRYTIPEIVISNDSNLEQNDPWAINTVSSLANNQHDLTDRATDDGYDSVVVDSFLQENDTISQDSDVQFQSSTKAYESVKSVSISEVFPYVASEDILPCPQEKHTNLNETTKHSRIDSNEFDIEHNSSNLNISARGTCNSTKNNLSNLQNTCETEENNVDFCKSAFANISSSPFITTDSVNTNLSKSIVSSSSNDYDSLPFKFTMISLNCTESQSQDGDAECERGTWESCQTLSSFSNCEAVSDCHDSILSNFISEADSRCETRKSSPNMSTHLAEERSNPSNMVNHLSPVSKNTDKSPDVCIINVNKVTEANEERNSTPVRNITCTSKIPVRQKSPVSSSGSSKEKGDNVKSNRSECCGDGCNGYFPNCHPFLISMSPVTYDINTDNLVTRSPDGSIIPTACNGSRVQTFVSTSANYVHVMTSEKISELAKDGFLMKPFPCGQEVSASCERERFESEDNEAFGIEAEHGSVLCSSLGSSSSSKDSLNDTLTEMEMMMKHGYDYMCSKDDLSLNHDSDGVQNSGLPVSVPKPEPEQKPIPRGLTQCQYIRSSREEIKPSTFHKEFKDIYGDATRTPVSNTYSQKPASAGCPRQLQRLKKTINFSNIRSPVGAYIKDRPVPLLKTAGKVKPCGRDDIPSRMFEKEFVGSSAKQIPLKSKPILPEIVYETAPGINVNKTRTTERCGPSKKNYATPTVIKHAGRAVLATVPQNALQMIKNTEISVLYDKDVSKTATL